MVMMTTRSQPRRRKVRQDLVDSPLGSACLPVCDPQVEASTAFPGRLAAGRGPSMGTAVVKRCWQASGV